MRRHVEGQVEDYLMEWLAPEQRREFEFHTTRCRSCAEALQHAQQARSYLECLLPDEAPPTPGPDFFWKVQRSIEQKRATGWFGALATSLHPHLAYPLLLLGLLLAAWTLTFELAEREEGLLAMEFPSALFASMSFSEDDRGAGRDRVMMTLVEMPEED